MQNSIDYQETTKIIERNVNALRQRKEEDRKSRTLSQKLVEAITSFAGSMLSIYIHCIFFGLWICWNAGWVALPPFDPSFIILATFAAVEAIFLTTFVLIGQKHLNAQADKWAELDLQISLLTEHEVTRMLTMVTAMAKKMAIEVAEDKEIEALTQDIHPEKVLDTMEKASK
jgi:uncharacterized membrane protein